MTANTGSPTRASHGEENIVDLCPSDVPEENTIAFPLSAAVQRFFWASKDEEAIVRFVAGRIHATPSYKHLSLEEILDATQEYVHDIRVGERKKKLFNAYVGDRVPPIEDPQAVIPMSHEAIEEMLSRSESLRVPVP